MNRELSRSMGATRPILVAALLASTALGTAVPALAQQMAAADTPADAAASEELGEIVVTATKRSESMQRVPISIQALGTEKLEQQQVASFDDYAKLLPSVSYQSYGPGQSQLFFRGISSGGDGARVGSLPTSGLYVDEIPLTTIATSVDLHIYDVARVEALSGPQGTLFGASSLSGTLRIITNKPNPNKFEAGYDVQGNKFGDGDYGGSAEAFVNMPLSDSAAIRLVGFYQRDGGYIDNTPAQRTYTLGDLDPSNDLTIDNSAEVKKNFNSVETYGGRAALRIDLDDNWTATPAVIYQHQNAKGAFLYDPRAGDLEVHDFTPDFNLDRWYQASLTIEGKVGNWDLVYSGGYFGRKIDNQTDYSYYSVAYDQLAGYYYTYFPDGAGGFVDPTQRQFLHDKLTKQSHELRVTSPAGERLRLTAGMFYQRQTDDIFADYVITGISGIPTPPTTVPIPGFGDSIFRTRLNRVDRDYAMFGEASFDISAGLTLTAGIRGFIVNNTLFGFSGFASSVDPATCLPTTNTGRPCTNVDKRQVESGETHRANLTYQIDADRMVYATYSTGYRPGGNNRKAEYGPYKSDTLSNFELGWKTSWFDRHLRINGAIFYEKWDDLQFALARPGDFGVTSISNVGGAEVRGIELDAAWRIGGLELSGASTYAKSKLTTPFCSEDFSGNVLCTPVGTRLPLQPRFKVNGNARYNVALGGTDSFVQASVLHQSGLRSFLLDQDVATVGSTKGFTTLDFSAGAAFNRMTVELFLQNAFDKRGELSRNTACATNYCGQYYRIYPVKPRFFGIKFGQRF